MEIAILLLGAALLGMLHDAAATMMANPPTSIPSQYAQTGRQVSAGEQKVSHVNVPLTGWLGGTNHQWYGTIAIGTPPQNFTVLFTTGFSDLILTAQSCDDCGSRHTFDTAASSSFSLARDGPVRVAFSAEKDSSPEVASCRWAYDQVTIANLTQPDQSLILCDEFPLSLGAIGVDGILGLAPRNQSHAGKTPLFWNLWQHDQFDEPVFSLYLPGNDTTNSEIILGGVDPTKYSGEMFMLDVNKDAYERRGTWAHRFEAVQVNGQRLPRSVLGENVIRQSPFPSADAVLDFGIPFIELPDYKTARDLYSSLSTEIQQIDSTGA